MIPLPGVLGSLKSKLDPLFEASPAEVGVWGCTLRAALVKLVDLSVLTFATAPATNAFFLAPCLRGCCEDLIALSFIGCLEAEERDTVMSAWAVLQSVQALEAQDDYFTATRPWQPVLRATKQPALLEELRAIAKKHHWAVVHQDSPWPKTQLGRG